MTDTKADSALDTAKHTIELMSSDATKEMRQGVYRQMLVVFHAARPLAHEKYDMALTCLALSHYLALLLAVMVEKGEATKEGEMLP